MKGTPNPYNDSNLQSPRIEYQDGLSRKATAGIIAGVAVGAVVAFGPEIADTYKEVQKNIEGTSHKEIQEQLGVDTKSTPVLEQPAQPTPGSLPEVALQRMAENPVVIPGQSVES